MAERIKFGQIGWLNRLHIIAATFLLLGLVLPRHDGATEEGPAWWATGQVNFERKGDWSGAPRAYIMPF